MSTLICARNLLHSVISIRYVDCLHQLQTGYLDCRDCWQQIFQMYCRNCTVVCPQCSNPDNRSVTIAGENRNWGFSSLNYYTFRIDCKIAKGGWSVALPIEQISGTVEISVESAALVSAANASKRSRKTTAPRRRYIDTPLTSARRNFCNTESSLKVISCSSRL